MNRLFASALICGLAACAPPVKDAGWVTIGVVDDSPDLYRILGDAGIHHAEDGSIVYSLLVPEADADRATSLLLKHRVGKPFGWFRTRKEAKARFQAPAARRPWTSDTAGRLFHSDYVNSIAFSPDGKLLASGTYDGLIVLWDPEAREVRTLFQGDLHKVNSVAFSPLGRFLASGGEDGVVRVWDLEKPGTFVACEGNHGAVNHVTFDPEGRRVASAGRDMTVRTWEADTGRAILSLPHPDEVFALAFTPGGRTLATGGRDSVIRLWHSGSGVERGEWRMDGDVDIHALAFSPDGRALAAGVSDPHIKSVEHWTVRALDVATGTTSTMYLGAGRWSTRVAFSPDGRFLAASGEDSSPRIWEFRSGLEKARLTKHEDVVESIAFSPDGRRVASGGRDGTIRLWDVAPLLR